MVPEEAVTGSEQHESCRPDTVWLMMSLPPPAGTRAVWLDRGVTNGTLRLHVRVPTAPIPSRWWHTHGGDLDEESLSDSHAGTREMDGDGVAVLHAWVPVANPAGPFVAENWALPFLRAGLVVPAEFSIPSARALALGTGTGALSHCIAQFRRHAHPDGTTDSAVVNAFTVAHDTVAGWLARRDGSSLSAGELRWLDGVWQHVEAQVLASHITSRRD